MEVAGPRFIKTGALFARLATGAPNDSIILMVKQNSQREL
jgi:hypothetical protein